jgi:hypothetical protein
MDDPDPPTSGAIANGWADFAETVLPSTGCNKHAQAHIAFYFRAMYIPADRRARRRGKVPSIGQRSH